MMDMATCEPLPNALISLFHCNATRSCSSFTGFGPTIPFERLLDSLNLTMSNRVTILNVTIGGDPNGNYTMGVTDIHSDDETWLRGVWPTNKEGMLESRQSSSATTPSAPSTCTSRCTRIG